MSKTRLPPGWSVLGDVQLILLRTAEDELVFACHTLITGATPYDRVTVMPSPEDALDAAWRDDVRNDCSVWPDLLVEVMYDACNMQLKAF